VFGLHSPGKGICEVSGIGFPDFANTHSITTGSLTIHYWNELAGTTTVTLIQAAAVDAEQLTLSSTGSLFVGSAVQIDKEIVVVNEILDHGGIVRVARGAFDSIPAAHTSGAKAWHLQRRRYVLPFVRGIFGTPAAGSYSQTITVPDIRIAAAELYVTNVKGNSQVGVRCYTREEDGGVRTLSGGQFSMQVSGTLSVQSAAVPGLSVETGHAVRDMYATVLEPSTVTPITVQVTCDGEIYATLTIPAGETLCDPVLDGLTLPPLKAGSTLGLDVVGVGSDRPGAGLTVTIRF
jgi:hypothetical protein